MYIFELTITIKPYYTDRYDGQIDGLRNQLDTSQKTLQEKISHYEQVVSGKESV